MNRLPKIALGAWAWGNDGTFGGNLTAEMLRPIFDAGMANGLNEKDKINYHVFKPVLFEFPTYEYFITGDKLGDCGKMNL